MATAEHILSLVKAHYVNDNGESFAETARSLADYEENLGKVSEAERIRFQVHEGEKTYQGRSSVKDDFGLIETRTSNVSIDELIVKPVLKEKLERVIEEYQNKDLLAEYGLKNRSKLLLEGPPGTGKTMSASVLASALRLPLCLVMTDQIFSSYLGESAKRLKTVFQSIRQKPGVYLFDEFDALGNGRTSSGQDVGEMRRILAAFLQFVEADRSDSIILTATNLPTHLDFALFRRFDDSLSYSLPTKEEINRLIKQTLGEFYSEDAIGDDLIAAAYGLSHAEIVSACRESMKDCLMSRAAHGGGAQLVCVANPGPYIRQRQELAAYRPDEWRKERFRVQEEVKRDFHLENAAAASNSNSANSTTEAQGTKHSADASKQTASTSEVQKDSSSADKRADAVVSMNLESEREAAAMAKSLGAAYARPLSTEEHNVLLELARKAVSKDPLLDEKADMNSMVQDDFLDSLDERGRG